MRHCRRASLTPTTHRYSSTNASTSPYAPENFAQPMARSPNPPNPQDDTSQRPFHAHPLTQPPRRASGSVASKPKFSFLTFLGLAPKQASSTYEPAPFRVNNNPYRARTKWPPDFRNLDTKQQFHFEKTFRRRTALKWARPRWNKIVKLVQHTLITFTIIYFVFILEPDHGMGTPFDGFRVWFFDKLGQFGQLPESTREEASRLSQEAREKMKRPVDDKTSPVATS